MNCVPESSVWQKRFKKQIEADEVSVGVHLAIFVEPYLTAVLEGQKTIESRFAITRRPPYNCIEPADFILLKKSGGPVIGIALAKSTDFYKLTPAVLGELRRKFSRQLYATDDDFWEDRASKLYATLIELDDPTPIEPLTIVKRDRQGWITYDRGIRQLTLSHA